MNSEVFRLRHNGKSAGLYTRSRRLQLSKCIIGLSTSSLPLLPFLQIAEIGTVISAWHWNSPLHLNLFARYRLPSWTQWSSICRLSPADFSCLSLSSACLPFPPSPSLFTDRYCSYPTMDIFRCTIISLPICFGCLRPLLVWRLVTCLCVIYIYIYIYIYLINPSE